MTHTHFTNGMHSPESERRLVGFAANMTAPEAPDGAEVVKARGDGDLYETMRKNVEHLQKEAQPYLRHDFVDDKTKRHIDSTLKTLYETLSAELDNNCADVAVNHRKFEAALRGVEDLLSEIDAENPDTADVTPYNERMRRKWEQRTLKEGSLLAMRYADDRYVIDFPERWKVGLPGAPYDVSESRHRIELSRADAGASVRVEIPGKEPLDAPVRELPDGDLAIDLSGVQDVQRTDAAPAEQNAADTGPEAQAPAPATEAVPAPAKMPKKRKGGGDKKKKPADKTGSTSAAAPEQKESEFVSISEETEGLIREMGKMNRNGDITNMEQEVARLNGLYAQFVEASSEGNAKNRVDLWLGQNSLDAVVKFDGSEYRYAPETPRAEPQAAAPEQAKETYAQSLEKAKGAYGDFTKALGGIEGPPDYDYANQMLAELNARMGDLQTALGQDSTMGDRAPEQLASDIAGDLPQSVDLPDGRKAVVSFDGGSMEFSWNVAAAPETQEEAMAKETDAALAKVRDLEGIAEAEGYTRDSILDVVNAIGEYIVAASAEETAILADDYSASDAEMARATDVLRPEITMQMARRDELARQYLTDATPAAPDAREKMPDELAAATDAALGELERVRQVHAEDPETGKQEIADAIAAAIVAVEAELSAGVSDPDRMAELDQLDSDLTDELRTLRSAPRSGAESREAAETMEQRYERVKKEQLRIRDTVTKYNEAGDQWGSIESGKLDFDRANPKPFLYKKGTLAGKAVLLAYSPNGGMQIMDKDTGVWRFMYQLNERERAEMQPVEDSVKSGYADIITAEAASKSYEARVERNRQNHRMEEECLKNQDATLEWFGRTKEGEPMWQDNKDIKQALEEVLGTPQSPEAERKTPEQLAEATDKAMKAFYEAAGLDVSTATAEDLQNAIAVMRKNPEKESGRIAAMVAAIDNVLKAVDAELAGSPDLKTKDPERFAQLSQVKVELDRVMPIIRDMATKAGADVPASGPARAPVVLGNKVAEAGKSGAEKPVQAEFSDKERQEMEKQADDMLAGKKPLEMTQKEIDKLVGRVQMNTGVSVTVNLAANRFDTTPPTTNFEKLLNHISGFVQFITATFDKKADNETLQQKRDKEAAAKATPPETATETPEQLKQKTDTALSERETARQTYEASSKDSAAKGQLVAALQKAETAINAEIGTVSELEKTDKPRFDRLVELSVNTIPAELRALSELAAAKAPETKEDPEQQKRDAAVALAEAINSLGKGVVAIDANNWQATIDSIVGALNTNEDSLGTKIGLWFNSDGTLEEGEHAWWDFDNDLSYNLAAALRRDPMEGIKRIMRIVPNTVRAENPTAAESLEKIQTALRVKYPDIDKALAEDEARRKAEIAAMPNDGPMISI